MAINTLIVGGNVATKRNLAVQNMAVQNLAVQKVSQLRSDLTV